ncbi:hypothetical protein B0O99DRAFT_695870 [Bisporella sp. PMI_857]|nr:hypothetical protein B0O99DRAFT_695870 [Bisporella sp. PMI_857]
MRRCDDGSLHEGKLELVTWDTPENPDEDYSEAMGWGAVVKSEAEEFKQKFESELGADEKKLYKEWPQAFRWTCCGTGADMKYGCDHHGTGSRPCTCDFCKMGKPLTEKIYNNRLKSVHGKGLDLPRGPDPRSFNSRTAETNAMARDLLGMDN